MPLEQTLVLLPDGYSELSIDIAPVLVAMLNQLGATVTGKYVRSFVDKRATANTKTDLQLGSNTTSKVCAKTAWPEL